MNVSLRAGVRHSFFKLRQFERPSEMKVVHNLKLHDHVEIAENLFVDDDCIVIHYHKRGEYQFSSDFVDVLNTTNTQLLHSIPIVEANRYGIISNIHYFGGRFVDTFGKGLSILLMGVRVII